MAANFHAEHVGSLLRPPELLRARESHARGEMPTDQLRELEDRAVLDAIELQRQAGIQAFTDGEMRRSTWMAGLLETLTGVVSIGAVTLDWHRDQGGDPSAEDTRFDSVAANARVGRR